METPQNEQVLLAIVIRHTHIYGSAEGNSLLVLTEKNKGSFVNVYEGG